jgi:hypothetical protein
MTSRSFIQFRNDVQHFPRSQPSHPTSHRHANLAHPHKMRRDAVRILIISLVLACTTLVLTNILMPRFASSYLVSLFWISGGARGGSREPNGSVEWHKPKQTWVNDLDTVINGTGTYGFWFGGSELPPGTKYGGYNYCNMPHVRREEYPRVGKEYELKYVEVVRHANLALGRS